MRREKEWPDCYHVFVTEMGEAGYDVQEYRGRFFYHGPAAVVEDLQGAIRSTSVWLRWDDFGKGYIVYPQARSDEETRRMRHFEASRVLNALREEKEKR